MTTSIKRVSQNELVSVVEQAVQLEAVRIELIDGEHVDGVSGGLNPVTDVIDIIMGLVLGDRP